MGAEPAGKEWIGQRVVPKYRNYVMREERRQSRRAAKIAIYRVEQVKRRLAPTDAPTEG